MIKKIKAVIFLIAACFVIAGCATVTDSRLTKDVQIKRPDKAILVYRPTSDEIWNRLDIDHNTKNEIRYTFDATRFTRKHGHYHFYMIEPGIYSLDYLFLNYGARAIELEKIASQKLVTFEANVGEIIYIGDIDFSYYHKGIFSYELRAKLEDKYEEAKAFLAKEHPETDVNLLKKRLAIIKPGVEEK